MTQLNFIKQGQGPLLVLSHALGCDLHMWDEVAARMEKDFTVLRYDHRSHGSSTLVTSPFSMADMADDIAALLASIAAGPAHFAGTSLGGMVAQSLAARHPSAVRSIVIANSAGYYDDAGRAGWQARMDAVAANGLDAIADGALQRWFTPAFLSDPAAAPRLAELRRTLVACDPQGYIASCGAVSQIDFRESNRRIACPALIIAGTQDAATPPALSQDMHSQIAGSRLADIDAAHISAVELPDAFTALLREFLK
ncbi:MAG: 3-oxoadipate enol-lactonase [Lacisediminimonas sp.]|nr:3-oxoadipate enol-lactonase [Lacisediminimonas sp.]MDO8300800.1 3-oxoadipate enol-lactonase [Lacisediminimonas sp.]